MTSSATSSTGCSTRPASRTTRAGPSTTRSTRRWLERLAGTLAAAAAGRHPVGDAQPGRRAAPRRRQAGPQRQGPLPVRPRPARPLPHDRFRRRTPRRRPGLLDWLVAHPSPVTGRGWRPCPAWPGATPIRGRTSGFFAPRNFPNRVVTSFVGQALLDGVRDARATSATSTRPRGAVEFLLDAPKTLFEDERHRCVSYVPDPAVTWIVMDVSALERRAGRPAGALDGDAALMEEAGRLVRYVVSQADRRRRLVLRRPAVGQPHHPRQLPHRFHPRRDRRVHATRPGATSSWRAYDTGSTSTSDRLFEPDGAARFMSDQR